MNDDFAELEQAARELRHNWDSPQLWPRIAAGLESRKPRRNPWIWTASIAAMLAVALTLSALRFTRKPSAPSASFLTQQAMQDVENADAAYARSIEGLSKLVAPSLVQPASALLVSYRDKLALLDQAIAELRAETSVNPYHAGLRVELGTLYREKQMTLQEVLRYEAQSRH